MATVIVMQDLNQLKLAMLRLPEANNQAIVTISNRDGKALFNDINNRTRVRTGNLKRGNTIEILPNGFRYYNNVHYAGFMNTGRRGNRFVEEPFMKFKANVIRNVNEEVAKNIKLIFQSFGTTKALA